MVSIVFCKYSVANIEIKLHFINICHDYFMLFDTEMTVEISHLQGSDKVLIK